DTAAAFSGEIEYEQDQIQRQRSAEPARAHRPVHRSFVGGGHGGSGALAPRPPPSPLRVTSLSLLQTGIHLSYRPVPYLLRRLKTDGAGEISGEVLCPAAARHRAVGVRCPRRAAGRGSGGAGG